MEKMYISEDIEASGPTTPIRYSMLSLGACVVGDTDTNFYREIRPISRRFTYAGMRVAAKGLRCLDDLKYMDAYNPESRGFSPQKVLSVLFDVGIPPEIVMKDYAAWVRKVTRGYTPVEIAAPIKWDGGSWISIYFDMFYKGKNPFGHKGDDLNSLFRGLMRDEGAHVWQLGIRGDDLPHNALEDSIIQGKEVERVLEILRMLPSLTLGSM